MGRGRILLDVHTGIGPWRHVVSALRAVLPSDQASQPRVRLQVFTPPPAYALEGDLDEVERDAASADPPPGLAQLVGLQLDYAASDPQRQAAEALNAAAFEQDSDRILEDLQLEPLPGLGDDEPPPPVEEGDVPEAPETLPSEQQTREGDAPEVPPEVPPEAVTLTRAELEAIRAEIRAEVQAEVQAEIRAEVQREIRAELERQAETRAPAALPVVDRLDAAIKGFANRVVARLPAWLGGRRR